MSILYRISINTPQDYLQSDEGVAGGYKAKLTRLEDVPGYFDDWPVSPEDDQIRKNIQSVQVDEPIGRIVYDRKTSYADYASDRGSFYWDNENQIIYIRFNVALPVVSGVLVGVAKNYTTSNVEYFDGLEHLPYVRTNFTIEKSVDSLEVSKLKFIEQDIEFINTGAEQDNFIGQPVPGNIGQIIFRNDDTGEEKEIYSGFVASDGFTTNSYRQTLKDLREKENIAVPSTRFNSTDYPDIDDDLIGDIIPEGYGPRREVECFPLNTNGSGDVEFKFATDATAITTVWYEDDDGAWQTIVPATIDAANGEFTLASATIRKGDNVRKVKAKVTLRNITNPGDIIQDMNERYIGTQFDSTNYNTTEWATEKAKLADVGLYMGEDKELFEWYELLQVGSDKNFLYDIQGDGRRTLRVDDKDREINFRFRDYKILNDDKPVTRDFTQYQSKVTILYDQNDYTEGWQRVTDDTFEDIALERYGFRKELPEQETLLTSESDAEARAALFAEDRSAVRPVYTVRVKIDQDELFDLNIYERGVLYFGSDNREYWGERVVKIIGIDIDPATEEVIYTLREEIDQTVPETSDYVLDTSGFPFLDTNGEYVYDTSGTIWEVG